MHRALKHLHIFRRDSLERNRIGPLWITGVLLAGLFAAGAAVVILQIEKGVPSRGMSDVWARVGPAPSPRDRDSSRALPSIPFPGATEPDRVRENVIAALKAQPEMTEGIRDLVTQSSQLSVRRVLDVTMLPTQRRYLVVELTRPGAQPSANVLMTLDGQLMMLEPTLREGFRRSLGLDQAAAKVRSMGRRGSLQSRYVYFHNQAEFGLSFGRPLVEVRTDTGTVYVNSAGEAFTEDTAGAAPNAAHSTQAEGIEFKALRPLK